MVMVARVDIDFVIQQLREIRERHGNIPVSGWETVRVVEDREAEDPSIVLRTRLEVGTAA